VLNDESKSTAVEVFWIHAVRSAATLP